MSLIFYSREHMLSFFRDFNQVPTKECDRKELLGYYQNFSFIARASIYEFCALLMSFLS